jgi:hypothetical protein
VGWVPRLNPRPGVEHPCDIAAHRAHATCLPVTQYAGPRAAGRWSQREPASIPRLPGGTGSDTHQRQTRDRPRPGGRGAGVCGPAETGGRAGAPTRPPRRLYAAVALASRGDRRLPSLRMSEYGKIDPGAGLGDGSCGHPIADHEWTSDGSPICRRAVSAQIPGKTLSRPRAIRGAGNTRMGRPLRSPRGPREAGDRPSIPRHVPSPAPQDGSAPV